MRVHRRLGHTGGILQYWMLGTLIGAVTLRHSTSASLSLLALVDRRRALTPADPSAALLSSARQRLGAAVDIRQADARDLPFTTAEFDRVVSGLMLNFVPGQSRATAEMVRVVRPGGELALYVWDYAGKMGLMRYFWDAAAALDPRAGELDEGKRFQIRRPEALHKLFVATGLVDVETRAIDIPTIFQDFDDYWTPFLGGQGPAPGYCVSLSDEERARLREQLRTSLPTQSDGSIDLIARAWAVRGRKS